MSEDGLTVKERMALWKNKEKKEEAPTPIKAPPGPLPGRLGKLASPEPIAKVSVPPVEAPMPLPPSLPDVPSAPSTEATPAKPPGGSIADRIKSMNTPIPVEPIPSRPVSASVTGVTTPAATCSDDSPSTGARRPSIKEMARQFNTPIQPAADTGIQSLKTPSQDTEDRDSESAVRRKSLKIAQLGQGINIAALMGGPPPKRAPAEATSPACEQTPPSSGEHKERDSEEAAAAEGELQHLTLSRPVAKKGSSRKKTSAKFTADDDEPLVQEHPAADAEA